MLFLDRFSLKTKFFVFLLGLTSITLLSFVILAIRIFEKDKLAFVIDSSQQLTASLAAQSQNQLVSLQKDILPILKDFEQNHNFAVFAKTHFQNTASLQAIGIYEINKQDLQSQAVLEKTPNLLSETLTAFPQLKSAILSMNPVSRRVLTPYNDERILYIEPLQTNLMAISVFMADQLKGPLKKSNGSASVLMQKNTELLFDLQNQGGLPLKALSENKSFQNFLNSELNQQSLIVQENKSKAWMVALVKVGMGDLVAVSFTNRDKVLEALNTLAKRSFYFLGLVVSLTFVLSILLTRSLTSRLDQLVEATDHISRGNFHIQLGIKSKDEVGRLSLSFQRMSQSIIKLIAENAAKARMEAELETAKAVQDNLFPVAQKNYHHLQICGHYEPASECSGDWWYYDQWGDQYIMCIGDATGHGAPAALLTSAARAAFATAYRQNLSASALLEWINHAIFQVAQGRLNMTLLVAIYNPQTRAFTYSNASHEPAFLIKGKLDKVSRKDLIILLDANGPRLGESNDTLYKEKTLTLDAGDTVYFYTDGVSDLTNKENLPMGERKFLQLITESFSKTQDLNERVQIMTQMIQKYRDGATLNDDITFFTCQVPFEKSTKVA